MNDGAKTGEPPRIDADDVQELTSDGAVVDLSEFGLTEELLTGFDPDVAVTFPLFGGAELTGPFHKMGVRGPLIEVWQVELLRTGQGTRGKAGGYVGELDHDADDAAVLEAFGPGIWLCRIRLAGAKWGRERWVKVGTVSARIAVAKKREREAERIDDGEAPRGSDTERALLDELREMRAERERDRELQAERMEELRAEMRQRDRDELAELRRQVNQPRPATAGGDFGSLLTQLETRMAENERFQELFGANARAPETPAETDFVSSVMRDLGTVMDQVEKGGNLLNMLDGGKG